MIDFNYFKTSFKDPEKNNFFMAGTDEVGRGPLAGPVVAASVSLHFLKYEEKELKFLLKEWRNFGINDSKKLTSEKMTVDQIYTHSYSKNITLKVLIKAISAQEIDEINILNASLKAMKAAVSESCDLKKDGVVLIDGNRAFKAQEPQALLVPIIKGDSKSLLIGMASIIAKEYRDELMARYCEQYPGYHWKSNAGYGTAKHREAISLLGVTEIHRKTFGGVREFYEERG